MVETKAEFPRLPVVEKAAGYLFGGLKEKLAKTRFVCVQHLLESTGTLFEELIRYGAKPKNIYVLGKSYSTNTDVAERVAALGVFVGDSKRQLLSPRYSAGLREDATKMWEHIVQSGSRDFCSTIILDDGGIATETLPDDEIRGVVAVEQTAFGIKKAGLDPLLPQIDVARSAAKRFLEPPFVAEATLNRLTIPNGSRVGIVGVGSVGSGLLRRLVERNIEVFLQDKHQNTSIESQNITWVKGGAQHVSAKVDILLGCTGSHLNLCRAELANRRSPLLLASCSSENIEFYGLVKQQPLDNRNRFEHVVVSEFDDGIVQVLNAGFPLNFDRSRISVPNRYIQLTRALLLAGVRQALDTRVGTANSDVSTISLNSQYQSMICQAWGTVISDSDHNYLLEPISRFNNVDWISYESTSK